MVVGAYARPCEPTRLLEEKRNPALCFFIQETRKAGILAIGVWCASGLLSVERFFVSIKRLI